MKHLITSLIIAIFLIPITSSADFTPLSGSELKDWAKSGGFRHDIKPGSRSNEVKLLQQLFNNIYPKDFPSSNITGFLGPKTRRTIARFQKHFGIKDTGRMDETTRALLNFIYFKQLCPEPNTDHIDQSITASGQELNLPADYVPDNLVDLTTRVQTIGVVCLDKDAAYRLEEMFKTASEAGIKLAITSGFRNPAMQSWLYDYWHKETGAAANQAIALPQNSEHQLGVAVDLTGASIKNVAVNPKFAKTKEGQWLSANAYRYGFILSYPEGKSTTTGYQYEPWHWRYVGLQLADKLRKLGITYPEYLKSI